MLVKLHKKQRLAFESQRKIVVTCSGIQGGKTFVGSLKMRKKVHDICPNVAEANFLVTAPTTKIFYQATLPAFLKTFKGMGAHQKTRGEFELSTDKKIFLRTVHEPDAIEGITDCYGIWPDEAGMYKRKAWVNIEGRAAFKRAQIWPTTTPYALNWLWKDLYKPWKKGERDDVDFIQYRSIDNPYFPADEFERQRKLLDPKVFAMKYEGQFERMAGLVYADIDDDLNFCDPFTPNNRDYYMVGGIDFGYTNPFAITVRALHRHEERDFQCAEYYESYLDTDKMAQACMRLQKAFGIEIFFADSEDPQGIADLNRAGVRVVGAKKGPGSVKDGIMNHNALIRSREYKIFKGRCQETEDEYATYHYKEDEGDEKNIDENPVDNHNHLMKANEYVTRMTKEFRRNRAEAMKPVTYDTISQEEKAFYGLPDITEPVSATEENWNGIS